MPGKQLLVLKTDLKKWKETSVYPALPLQNYLTRKVSLEMFQQKNEEGMIDLEYHHFQSLMQTSDKEKNQIQCGS